MLELGDERRALLVMEETPPPTSTFPAQPLLSALTGARVRVGDGFGCDGPDHLAAEPASRALAESARPIHLLVGLALGVDSPPGLPRGADGG